MLIKVLSENTSLNDEFLNEHGLSIYIETEEKKILFDTGASELFLDNAQTLHVGISDVDYLIISHAHYDHGGGIEAFLRENTKAKIFVHRLALENYYFRGENEDRYIGLNQRFLSHGQISLTSGCSLISDGVEIFSDVVQKYPHPAPDSALLMEREGKRIPDDFSHEQNLIIEENGKSVLLTGCSHNGIINILEHFKDMKGKMPDVCIGGFHLYGMPENDDSLASIDEISRYLLMAGTMFYTGHCTGQWPFECLKKTMGSKIHYLPAGSILNI